MLEARVDDHAGPMLPAAIAPAPHADTDAQHSWVLEHFGINTRDPSRGVGQAVQSVGPGAAGGASLERQPVPAKASADGPDIPELAAAKARMVATLTGSKDRLLPLGNLGRTFETKRAHERYKTLTEALIRSVFAGGDPDASNAELEATVAELERLVADMPAKARAATDEAARISATADADLLRASAAQKVQMVETLLAAGQPSGAVRAAQIKIYDAMRLDPGFMQEDGKRGQQIAADLKDDAELKAARGKWGTTSEDDKLKALRKIVAAQSKRLGIAPPDVVAEHVPVQNGVVSGGDFSPSDGKLHINMDPSSPVQDFASALNVVLHENAHNYEAQLVKRLEAGQLKPGTPDYVQATMFRVNDLEPGGYIPGDTQANLPAYKKQPQEDYAWATGPATAADILKVL